MRFSLVEIFVDQGAEYFISFCSIETSTRESALLTINYLAYIEEWHFDLFYYKFMACWYRENFK